MTKGKVQKRSRARRWTERLLLFAGVVGLGAWVASNAVPAAWQVWENWVFEREVRGETTNFIDYLTEIEKGARRDVTVRLGREHVVPPPVTPPPVVPPLAPPTPSSATESPKSQPTIAEDSLIGRLTIPRLRLRATVREGVGRETLGLTLGHIPGTALPGENGNVAVAGHRDTLFRGLAGIEPNDVIQFETLDKSFVYEVESTEVVKPSNVGVLKPDSYPELTLVTCYPFNYIGPAPDRFIVKAREVSSDASDLEPVVQTTSSITAQRPNEPEIPRLGTPQKSNSKRIYFVVRKDHSRQLAPGISLGISDTDPASQQVEGWMWIMPDRRTVWLRSQAVQDPVVFYGHQDGKKREVVITNVMPTSAAGYLLLAGN